MVVGEKRRENKFFEKVRRNFEKFKDKIEKIGEKAIVLGAIGGIVLGGCANRETITWEDIAFALVEKEEELYDYAFKYGLSNSLLYGAEVEATRMRIYEGCKTRKDSIEATRRAWIERTGSANPRHWKKAVEDVRKKGDEAALRKFSLLILATYPYSTMLGFNDILYNLFEKYKDVSYAFDKIYSFLYYAAEVEATRIRIYKGCKTREDSIEATRRVWIEKTGSANPRHWEKAVDDARERGDMEALGKFNLLIFATYPYSTMLGFYDSLYELFEK